MRPVFGLLCCVGLVWGLALDSNTIRSSKDASEHKDSPNGNSQRPNRRGRTRSCSGPDCDTPPRGSCSNRPQRRQSSRDQDPDLDLDQDTDFGQNRTKAAEMGPCVRSGDCAAGLCCVRYLTGKRCQQIPTEGELCLLRAPKHRRANLGRCECAAGLTCARPRTEGQEQGQGQAGHKKGQGVCVPRPRKTRHSGKKRHATENSC